MRMGENGTVMDTRAVAGSASAPESDRRRGALYAVVAISLLLIFSVAWWLLGSLRERGPVLDDLMPNFTHDPIVSPVQVTDQVCPQERCVSAWDTELGTYLEFDTQARAEYLHQVLGDDARINGRVVLDLTGVDLDRASTERAVQLLFQDQDLP